MSTYEAPYKSILQGVSQQLPHERLPGQLTSQVNMLSDPVTNLRRRPGIQARFSRAWTGATTDSVTGWFTDIAGQRMHVLLNTATGDILMINEDFTFGADLLPNPYLVGDVKNMRAAAVGNEFFICNTAKQPVLQYGTGSADPANAGFFYVASGAFGKTYSVSVLYSDGTITASYTTPGGTGPGDAALSTPEYIATQLSNQLKNAGTPSPITMTDVRLVSVNFSDAAGVLQRNLGTAASPSWTTLSYPADIPIADIERGYLRVRWTNADTASGLAEIQFIPKINGAFSGTTYDAEPLNLPYSISGGTQTRTVPVTQFAGSTTAGPPVFYVAADGPYVYIARSGGISVSTNVGSAFLIASQSGFVTSEANLPARLPLAADGYIVRVGTGESPKYYRYNAHGVEWLECAKFGSPTGIANCPISIYWTGSSWALNTQSFEGQNAGDSVTNPVHEFMKFGITGMSTYQGRLVLMSGPLVSLSGSNKPRRFFRSTVTSLLGNDPIEIGSGMNSSAAYEWAVPFQKDLLLFSRAYQAVIPSGNVAITPATATVVPTSGHDVDTTSSPISIGRTLMYCNPRSEDFFGVLEMVPSQYTDSQYVSQDATAHLPKYMGGRCRFAVASSVSSMALFAPSGDKRSLIVHEYHWNDTTKDQQAWHQWVMPYEMATAYFVGDVVATIFVRNNQLLIGTIDARAGAVDSSGGRRPFLDFYTDTTITANSISPAGYLLAFDPTMLPRFTAIAATGPLAGELIGTKVNGSNLTTALSWPSGAARIGLAYYSGFIPTPPQATDYQNSVVHSGKATLLRFMVGTKNSSDFNVSVSDRYNDEDFYQGIALTFSSPELELGRGLFSKQEMNIVPCRTDMRTTSMEVSTNGTGELNITSLEYTAKFNPKIKRRS